jgi:hypothetical protein
LRKRDDLSEEELIDVARWRTPAALGVCLSLVDDSAKRIAICGDREEAERLGSVVPDEYDPFAYMRRAANAACGHALAIAALHLRRHANCTFKLALLLEIIVFNQSNCDREFASGKILILTQSNCGDARPGHAFRTDPDGSTPSRRRPLRRDQCLDQKAKPAASCSDLQTGPESNLKRRERKSPTESVHRS